MRIWTSIEYDYPMIKEGIYREVKKTLVHFEDGNGNIQTKIDKLEACRLMAANNERSSVHGVVEAKIGDKLVRLIAIG
jgi:hypothetical protein